MAELKKAGVYVMPYINGRLWDTHDKAAEDWQFTSVALAASTKDEADKPYTESYGSKESDGNSVQLAAMCPSTPLWQSDAIRAAKPADCMLTTECNAEPYVKWLDGYLTWHWQEQNMVSAFPAVYGGAIQMFGRAYRGGPSQDLANRMKAGQQLVFGEQIGWFGPEIINRPDCGQFLRDCIQLSWRLKEYFYAGQMARPPKLIGEIPKVTADWQWQGEWPIATPAAMTGAWQNQRQDKTVLLFVNVSDQSLAANVRFNPKEYDLLGKTLKVARITPGAPEVRFTIQATDQPQVEFAPRSVFAWEITTAPGG